MTYMQLLKLFFGRIDSVLVKRFFFLMTLFILGACVNTAPSVSSANRPVSDKALVHAKLAQGYLQQKQYAVAKDELERALDINPNHSESHYTMALLMLELQQYEESERHFMRAVTTDSSNSEAAHDFGTYLCKTGRERDSVKYFDIAAANPLFAQSYLSFMRAGECLARINDVVTAEAYLERALAINSRLGPALLQLASLKYDNGEGLSARAYMQRFLAVNKPQASALLLAYKIESNLRANDFAEEYRQRLLEEFPGSQQAREVRFERGER